MSRKLYKRTPVINSRCQPSIVAVHMNFTQKHMQQVKLLAITLAIALGVTYASAWVGPTATPPGNNVVEVIDESSIDQSKGGAGIVSGNLLDIDDVTNTNDTFSSQIYPPAFSPAGLGGQVWQPLQHFTLTQIQTSFMTHTAKAIKKKLTLAEPDLLAQFL